MTGLGWLCRREVLRVSKLWTQTVLAPVIASILFILVFGLSLGGRIDQVSGVDYEVFIVPGLITMGMVQAAYANNSSSVFQALGLQELLTMFHPMVAGVTIPGIAIVLLMLAPFVDKNPSNKPKDRKFAISMMTLFLMLWAVLVIIGSFFRGPGFNFTFPWNDGVFFEL